MAKSIDRQDDAEPPSRHRRNLFPDVSDEEWDDWRWQYKHRITTIEQLERLRPIDPTKKHHWRNVLQRFRMAITPYYLSLIDFEDPNDPIARQALPSLDEYLHRDHGFDDPLHEEEFSPVPGLTHRYPDRALMVISNICAMYCRHCTRKRLMFEGASPHIDVERMIKYITDHPEIRDVIVSGGDPLLLSTDYLDHVLGSIRAIPHVEIIRIGSRVPCVIPQRIDKQLCTMLAKHHPVWINVQFEHPRECTKEAADACAKLLSAGIPLNNQSVLLKGVNDSAETMGALIKSLVKMRVRPYYLFQCDPIKGAEHLRTPIAKGIEIISKIRGFTSGLAVPTYVIDAPGGGGKIPIGPEYMVSYDEKTGQAILRNYLGKLYEYNDPKIDETIYPIQDDDEMAQELAVRSTLVHSNKLVSNHSMVE